MMWIRKVNKKVLYLSLIAFVALLTVSIWKITDIFAASDSTVTVSTTEIGTFAPDLLGGNLSPWGIAWPSGAAENAFLADTTNGMGVGGLRWGHANKYYVDMDLWYPTKGTNSPNWSATGELARTGQTENDLSIAAQVQWLADRNIPVMYTLSDEISCAMMNTPSTCSGGLDYAEVARAWKMYIKYYIDHGVDVKYIEIGNEVDIQPMQGIEYPPVEGSSRGTARGGGSYGGTGCFMNLRNEVDGEPCTGKRQNVTETSNNDYIKLWDAVYPALKSLHTDNPALYPDIPISVSPSGQGPLTLDSFPWNYIYQTDQHKPDFYPFHAYVYNGAPGTTENDVAQKVLDSTWGFAGKYVDWSSSLGDVKDVLAGWGFANHPVMMTEWNYDGGGQFNNVGGADITDHMWNSMYVASVLTNAANNGIDSAQYWDTFSGSDTDELIGYNWEDVQRGSWIKAPGIGMRFMKQFRNQTILQNTVTSSDNVHPYYIVDWDTGAMGYFNEQPALTEIQAYNKRVESLSTKDENGNYKVLLTNKNVSSQHVVNLVIQGQTNGAANIKIYANKASLDNQTPSSTVNTNLSGGAVEVTLPAMSMAVVDVTPVDPNAIYVAKTGSDTTGDGTYSNPYLTVQKAADIATSGKTIYVRGGTYAERVTFSTNGTAQNIISTTNYGSEAVYLTGGFDIAANYNSVNGFDIAGATVQSVTTAAKISGDHNSVSHLNVHDMVAPNAREGIGIYGSYNIVTDSIANLTGYCGLGIGDTAAHNTVQRVNITQGGAVPNATNWDQVVDNGMDIGGSYNLLEDINSYRPWRNGLYSFGQNNTFRRITFWDQVVPPDPGGSSGWGEANHKSAIQTRNSTAANNLYDSIVFNAGLPPQGCGFESDTDHGAISFTITNSVFLSTGGYGANILVTPEQYYANNSAKIYNNVFYGPAVYTGNQDSYFTAGAIKLRNNIFIDSNGNDPLRLSDPGFGPNRGIYDSDYNLFDSAGFSTSNLTSYKANGEGTNSIRGPKGFTTGSTIGSSSAAINAGISHAADSDVPLLDAVGHSRVGATDIGAYEYIPDTTAPVVSAVTATGLTDTGATITWTTNEPADSQVDYGLTGSYGQSTTLNPSLVTSHSVVLSGLAEATTYHFRVKSKDSAGNPTVDVDKTFRTTGGSGTGPVVSFTFDDGTQEIYDYYFPILEAAGYVGTVYINTDNVPLVDYPGDGYMSLPDLTNLKNHGWEISSHKANHEYLPANPTPSDYATYEAEVARGKAWLDAHGFPNSGFAAPGASTDTTLDAIIQNYHPYDRANAYGNQTFPVTDLYNLSVNPMDGQTYSDLNATLVDAVANETWSLFLDHAWVASGSDPDVVVFQQVVNRVTALSIPVLTVQEVLGLPTTQGVTTLTGDINADGYVNIFDASIQMAKWGQTVVNNLADLNHDGSIGILDASILMANWGLHS